MEKEVSKWIYVRDKTSWASDQVTVISVLLVIWITKNIFNLSILSSTKVLILKCFYICLLHMV